jgi:hypothetical protein
MRNTASLDTRTEDLARRELPLPAPADRPVPIVIRERTPADRIREALQRWLEEEM